MCFEVDGVECDAARSDASGLEFVDGDADGVAGGCAPADDEDNGVGLAGHGLCFGYGEDGCGIDDDELVVGAQGIEEA